MAVTSLRRKLTFGAVLCLLLVPGHRPLEQALPHAEAIRTPLEDVQGLRTRTVSVATDHSQVGYRYPMLGGGHPLTVQARTLMARRQTDFLERLPQKGTPELHQDVTILAASSEVLGARLTATTSSGPNRDFAPSTLWYDADSDQVLPWTSLFRDEEAIEQAHLALARMLEEGYDIPAQRLPGLIGEVALRHPPLADDVPTPGPTPDTASEDGSDLADPEQAREAARHWAGSPLEDLAFSTDAGLAVPMNPSHVPQAGHVKEVLVPVEPEDTEALLSELGRKARDAALSGNDTDDLPTSGGPDSPGHTLDCARLKCVALTFDDGPGEYTDDLLDILAEYDAHATFYVLGSMVTEFPETVERMATEGHELGNHTWKHDDLAEMTGKQVEKDITRTDEAVREVTGTDPTTIRPPYGSLNAKVRRSVDRPLVMWDVDTMDWQSREAEDVSEHALSQISPGSVVLLHDIHETSVQAVPAVLAELHRQGYHFVTVTDVFGEPGLKPGEVYTDARPS